MGTLNSHSAELLKQLSRNSTPYLDPLGRIDWEALDRGAFWLPEEAISLYGTQEYNSLSIDQRRTLSQYELINFLQAGVWLEGIFMERLSRSLRGALQSRSEYAYRLHELREEAGHSLMFLELMRRANMPLPRPNFAQLRLANLLGRRAPFDSLLFWVAVLIGEEVPDRLNRFLRKARADICPAIFDIASVHVMEEARHIAHTRDTLERHMQGLPRWKGRLLAPLLRRVFRQFVEVFYFPSPQAYELSGLLPGARWVQLARHNPHRARFVDCCVGTTLGTLRERGIELSWR